MKKVIFNADDFGLTESVNKGILKCFKFGIVTDSSMLMNMDATHHAVILAKKNKLNVGVHLNLTSGKPLSSKVSSLVDKDGNFFDIKSFTLNLLFNKIKEKDIESEIKYQIEKLISSGIKPTHVDSHQYIHMFPKILKVIIKVAKKHKINKMRYMCENPIFYNSKNQFIKSVLVSTSSRSTKKIYTKNRIQTTDYFTGISQINSSNVLTSFIKSLRQIKAGTTEIMSHPGYTEQTLEKVSFYSKQREIELGALTSIKLKNEINKLNIKLISFRDL